MPWEEESGFPKKNWGSRNHRRSGGTGALSTSTTGSLSSQFFNIRPGTGGEVGRRTRPCNCPGRGAMAGIMLSMTCMGAAPGAIPRGEVVRLSGAGSSRIPLVWRAPSRRRGLPTLNSSGSRGHTNWGSSFDGLRACRPIFIPDAEMGRGIRKSEMPDRSHPAVDRFSLNFNPPIANERCDGDQTVFQLAKKQRIWFTSFYSTANRSSVRPESSKTAVYVASFRDRCSYFHRAPSGIRQRHRPIALPWQGAN